MQNLATAGVLATACLAPATGRADCFEHLVEWKCIEGADLFTARAFGTYNGNCPVDGWSDDLADQGLVNEAYLAQNPLSCAVAGKDVRIEPTYYRPSHDKGACGGHSWVSVDLTVDGVRVFGVEKLHGECIAPTERQISVDRGNISICSTKHPDFVAASARGETDCDVYNFTDLARVETSTAGVSTQTGASK